VTAITVGSQGRHTSAYTSLRRHARSVEADNRQLIAVNEQQADEIHTALIRGCQDAMANAQLRAENTALKKRVKELGDKVIRGGAEHQRLRQAVINARPRISVAVQRLDRPYVSHVQIPYPIPVGQWTANDETQQLPVIDRPEPWPVYATPTT
jgi:hypothetical protein